MRRLVASWLAVSSVIALAGGKAAQASSAPPATQDERETVFDADTERTLFVVAARQKPRIVRSLAQAGFDVRPNLLEARGYLRVTVGGGQGWRTCGTRNNVKFSLKREGMPLLELVEKGWTGTCEPNVFDVMSARLMREIAGGRQEEEMP